MIKLINYDISNGIVYILKKLIAFIAFILIMLIYTRFTIMISFGNDVSISAGDYLVYLFKGSKQLDLSSLDIPVVFIGIQIFIAMMVGYYAVDDIHGYGRQVFIRCKKKSHWWYSKCVWILATVIVSYSLIYLTVFGFSLYSGAEMTLDVNDTIIMYFDRLSLAYLEDLELLLHMFVTPLLYSVTISIVQVMLSLVIGPLLSFISVMIYTILSVLIAKPIFLCNYSMILRNQQVLGADIICLAGVISMLLVCVVSIAIGKVVVDKKDISL